MKFALLRSLQFFAMIIILSGLYIGIRDNNVMLELNALIIGAGIFYAANTVIKNSN